MLTACTRVASGPIFVKGWFLFNLNKVPKRKNFNVEWHLSAKCIEIISYMYKLTQLLTFLKCYHTFRNFFLSICKLIYMCYRITWCHNPSMSYLPMCVIFLKLLVLDWNFNDWKYKHCYLRKYFSLLFFHLNFLLPWLLEWRSFISMVVYFVL